MADTLIEQLAQFAANSSYDSLPIQVVEECKRLMLDSVGCALAAFDHHKGRIGIEYGRLLGGTGEASIIGTADRVSIFGAAFANGELINALDMDAVVPPGHVTPYVLPGALALAETRHAGGRELIRTMAVSHELSWRIGKAMDYLRDTREGQLNTPPVYGFSNSIFGATAAVAMLQQQSCEMLANSLGIASSVSPVQSMMSLFHHAPSSTIKYTMAGAVIQAAMMAAHMGLMGHSGDLLALDDTEFGYPRFIGTRRWEPNKLTDDLGSRWGFVSEQLYKPYPHCRILHGPLDCLIDIVESNDLRPDEIDNIKVMVEGFVEKPIWLNRYIKSLVDAQFSIAHGMALGAHRIKPGRDWQDPEQVFNPSVMALMAKVTHEVHPDYVKQLSAHASARPSRVEVTARGQTFVAERLYPKGSQSPDPTTAMSNDELLAKFKHNAEGVVAGVQADRAAETIMALEDVADIATLMKLVAAGSPARDAVAKVQRSA